MTIVLPIEQASFTRRASPILLGKEYEEIRCLSSTNKWNTKTNESWTNFVLRFINWASARIETVTMGRLEDDGKSTRLGRLYGVAGSRQGFEPILSTRAVAVASVRWPGSRGARMASSEDSREIAGSFAAEEATL